MIPGMRRLIALVVLSSSTALADPPMWSSEVSEQTCAASYDERLADARASIEKRWEYALERAAYMTTLQWFEDHCRFLEWEEIVGRKLDDPNSFVCDTKNGRPKNLDAATIRYFQHNGEMGARLLMKWGQSNALCDKHDVAGGRQSLVIPPSSASSVLEQRATMLAEIDIVCWRVASEKCAAMLAKVASWRATPSPSAPLQSAARTPSSPASPSR
jgi:hypothetical protein